MQSNCIHRVSTLNKKFRLNIRVLCIHVQCLLHVHITIEVPPITVNNYHALLYSLMHA